MIDITLSKEKYRRPGRLLHRAWDPPEGTRTWAAGRFGSKPRTNSGKATRGQSVGPRMRAYWGAVARP